ncbi:LysR family transcriptional regulator [Paraburkholderia sp. 31.1]|uniref:LysR family transcriptional regulator n=1 Tax=Paraburkholderia sp. 31.1 TaxID=2615205 RepID=UPI001654F821|nr:LysR family transcriptional regulator [Paraburkholderia sp. 31.1]MBC8725269.1 LysR family transcriptional regulator [Paraburkholderia sp. 31.1]
MNITLDELATFMAVVDTGSMTAAAQHLDLTVSAASRTLGRLEEKLKTTLMRRTTRRMELTEEGRAFLQHARAIIDSVESAEEQMVARRENPSGLLRINAASPFMLHVIAPLVQGYRVRYPHVHLELNTNDGIIDLLESRTDVAIRIGRLKDSTLHSRLVGSSRMRVLASPDYLEAHGHPREVADLGKHVLLGFTQPESLNVWPLLGADGEPYRIEPVASSSSGETLRQLALEGVGVVCLSDFMTDRDRETGRLVQILARQTKDVRQPIHAVYYRNTAVSSRIASFIDYLMGEIGGNGATRHQTAWARQA